MVIEKLRCINPAMEHLRASWNAHPDLWMRNAQVEPNYTAGFSARKRMSLFQLDASIKTSCSFFKQAKETATKLRLL